jgi:asparagine synthase (glutamine-hydrolysing)
MCGICGIVGPKANSSENKKLIPKMMDILAHRGPDDQGQISGNNFIFGHRRLAIIDIEHGRQPMQLENGRITLVYNGEIYNYLDLRQELIRKGAKFQTFSDTEVLLQAYEYYGIECLHKLNGMFAFALYDKHKQMFFAARDHFGIKPFYYSLLADGSIIFASEIKALLVHPQISSTINQSALHEYLTFQFCLGESTLFKGIKNLEPAHYLQQSKKNDSSVKVKRYWDLSYEIDTHHTADYFADTLLLLLQDSVHGQLRSDVPLGAYLSGGLDSSSVVTLARSQYGDGFKCFTGRFEEGPEYDESKFARLLTEHKNCEYYEAVPTAQNFIDLMPRLIYYMDEPAAGPGLFPQYMVSALAKDHVSVVLGGQGGDEIFGGYARYMVAYLEQCLKGAIFETQEEGKHIVNLESIIPNLTLLKQYAPLLKKFWREGLFEDMDQRYFRLIDRSRDLKYILNAEVWDSYNRDEIFRKFQKIFNNPKTKSYFNKMTYFDQQTLLPALLQVEDRVSMAVSLESRVPLLDFRIAELVASMPPTIKYRGGQTKYILKKTMGSLLPAPIVKRKDKMGFPVPLRQWWDSDLKEFVLDTLLSPTCLQRGMYNRRGLEYLLKNEGQFDRQVWGALCLELWNRIYLDGEIPL